MEQRDEGIRTCSAFRKRLSSTTTVQGIYHRVHRGRVLETREEIITGHAQNRRVRVAIFQHPLSSRAQPESILQAFELRPREWFRQDIGDVVGTGNIVDGNFIVLDCVTNEVVSNADMFGSLMELVVFGEGDRRLIIGVKRNSERGFGVDLIKYVADPKCLFCPSLQYTLLRSLKVR